jgi:F0F1-type ATP synthase membrane subunit b/b'
LPTTFEPKAGARVTDIKDRAVARNANYYDEESEKLDLWAEDKQTSFKSELKEYDDEIKALKKQARNAANLPEKLELEKKRRNLEKKREDAWKQFDSASKQINEQKDALIDELGKRLQQQTELTNLFKVKWKII